MKSLKRKIAGTSRFRYAPILGAVLAAIAIPAMGQPPVLGMLDRLEGGRWELRVRESGGEVQRICLQDGRRLIQLRHLGSACERLVVSDGANEVTVQYTCRGRGYGRTQIRMETGRLVQIQTQGIENGLPFSITMEGRRVGDCST